jgi:hypothetical protein
MDINPVQSERDTSTTTTTTTTSTTGVSQIAYTVTIAAAVAATTTTTSTTTTTTAPRARPSPPPIFVAPPPPPPPQQPSRTCLEYIEHTVPSLSVLLIDPDADVVASLCDATRHHTQHLHKNRFELQAFGLGDEFDEWIECVCDPKVPSYCRILVLLVFLRHTKVLFEKLPEHDRAFLDYLSHASEPWLCGRDSENQPFQSSRPEHLEDEHTSAFVWRMCQVYRWAYHVPQVSVQRSPA